MIHDDCPTDLIAKERRNDLTPLERRALAVHLSRCKNCRAWQQIGRDFDRAATAAADDAAVVERIADGIRFSSVGSPSKSTQRTTRRRMTSIRWMLLAALASSAAAAAAVTGWRISRAIPPPEVDRELTRSLPPSVEKEHVAPPSSVEPTRLEDLPQPDTQQPNLAPAPKKAESASVVALGEGESALSLYREANQARRGGEVSRSISIFRHLQQSFPRSPEAQLSNVALGSALLESGATREALQQYERYLNSSGKKSLAAEALYGRARALGAMGNRAQERAAWLRLSEEFPRSPYSATAIRRLQSLQ